MKPGDLVKGPLLLKRDAALWERLKPLEVRQVFAEAGVEYCIVRDSIGTLALLRQDEVEPAP